MTLKDTVQGWGTAPAGLIEWFCPGCSKSSAVRDWASCQVELGGGTAEGRKCPKCGFELSTLGHTDDMVHLTLSELKKRVEKDKEAHGKKAEA